MRRFLLVALAGLLNTAVFAQSNISTQIGSATHELQDNGLSAAHFSIPMGSMVTIANADTGEEIEVMIVGRISLSATRIIDLSQAAWDALGLTAYTKVVINPGNEANSAPAIPAPVVSVPTPTPVPASIDEEPQFAIQDEPDPQDEDEDYAVAVLTRSPIKVVPGLPNPNSKKIYRLQVGAYAIQENADIAERELKAAGFKTMREARGSLTRVVAVGIPAAEVKPSVQTLEDAGFGEVWIRE